MDSQHKNTNSKGDFTLKNKGEQNFKNKSESKRYISFIKKNIGIHKYT